MRLAAVHAAVVKDGVDRVLAFDPPDAVCRVAFQELFRNVEKRVLELNRCVPEACANLELRLLERLRNQVVLFELEPDPRRDSREPMPVASRRLAVLLERVSDLGLDLRDAALLCELDPRVLDLGRGNLDDLPDIGPAKSAHAEPVVDLRE